MDTEIRFLKELEGDLSAAAMRERHERVRPPRGPRFGGWRRVAAAAAAILVVAWGIGFVVQHPIGLGSSDEALRADGFSRQKNRYVRALSTALLDGSLDLDAVAALEDEGVRAALVALPGIGPWTAEVYLLSALRRPDTWPIGDIALQDGARRARGLETLPANLLEATHELKENEVVRAGLGTGPNGDYADYFIRVKREEWDRYHEQVSQWEITEYLTRF